MFQRPAVWAGQPGVATFITRQSLVLVLGPGRVGGPFVPLVLYAGYLVQPLGAVIPEAPVPPPPPPPARIVNPPGSIGPAGFQRRGVDGATSLPEFCYPSSQGLARRGPLFFSLRMSSSSGSRLSQFMQRLYARRCWLAK